MARFWLVGLSMATMMTIAATVQAQSENAAMLVYIGTYNGPKSEGIYLVRMDPATGALSKPELACKADRASFLAIHPNKKFIYSTAEIGEPKQRTGMVAAYAIDAASGKLTPLNTQPSGGRGPCHVSVDQTGRNVLVANYSGGSVSVVPIGDDGKLKEPSATVQHEGSGPHPKRQTKPYAHSINVSPDNKVAIAADLGTDKLLVYKFDAERGTLAPHDPPSTSVPPGGGPRHFTFHPNGKHAYVINEIASTVTALSYDPVKGTLSEIQTISTLPEGFTENNTTAEVQVHPSGKFLYGSNRGHDSIAVFSIDEQTGKLSAKGQTSSGGKTPRNFGIDPSGKFLIAAHQNTDNLVVFKIDPATGAISPTGATAEVGSPVCVKFFSPN